MYKDLNCDFIVKFWSSDMATQSQGIQQLLAAERRAAEKTAEARKRKNRRMKQAKDEAMVEIEKYKAEREAAYKEKEAKQLGSKEGIQAKIEEDTQVKIAAMTRSVEEGKGEVIASLIDLVCDIKPQVHKNYRPRE